MGQSGGSKYIVQKFVGGDIDGDRWADVAVLKATDPGAALRAAVIRNPTHRIEATTYRVAQEALTVNVSINLEVHHLQAEGQTPSRGQNEA